MKIRTLVLAVSLLVPATVHAQAVPPGGTIYAFDEAYSTTATPADVPDRGRFDAIYVLGGELAPVSRCTPLGLPVVPLVYSV